MLLSKSHGSKDAIRRTPMHLCSRASESDYIHPIRWQRASKWMEIERHPNLNGIEMIIIHSTSVLEAIIVAFKLSPHGGRARVRRMKVLVNRLAFLQIFNLNVPGLNVPGCPWNWQFEKNHHKLLFRRIFWNWYTNESSRFWILDSIRTVRFTNTITNI